jgi:hypothetical protein
MVLNLRHTVLSIALLGLVCPAAAVAGSEHVSEQRTNEERTALSAGEVESPVRCYANTSRRPSRPGIVPPDRTHGDNSSDVRDLWASDPDYPNLTASDRLSNDQLASVDVCRGDDADSSPPDVEDWNAPEHGSYESGGQDFSAAPAGVTTNSVGESVRGVPSDRSLLSDAYVEIFSVTPSTIVHHRDGRERYGAPNGTIRVITNYRAYEPNDDSKGTSVESWDIDNKSTETELLVDGEIVDNASSAAPTLTYSNLSGRSNLTVRSRISVELIDRSNSSESDVETYSLTVSDTETVTVRNLSAIPISGGSGTINESRLSPNESVVGLEIGGPWQELEFEAGHRVHSQWYFYTQTQERWTEWSGTSNFSGSRADGFQPIRPVEVHAVPVTAGPEITTARLGAQTNDSHYVPSLEVTHPEESVAPPPALPESITLDRAGNTTTVDRFTIRSDESLVGTGNFTLRGLVRGRAVNRSIDTSDPVQIRTVNISTEVLSVESSGADLRISVTDRTGNPVTDGTLAVSTQQSRVERTLTPASGTEIAVTLPQSSLRTVDLRYRPAEAFWEQSRTAPVRETHIVYTHLGEIPAIVEYVDFIAMTVLVLAPSLLLLYGLDVVTNGRLLNWYDP